MNTKIVVAALTGAVLCSSSLTYAGEPLSNVNVAAQHTPGGSLEHQATTNDSGEFTLTGLKAGEYILHFSGKALIAYYENSGADLSVTLDGKVALITCSILWGDCRTKPISLSGTHKGKLSLR